MTDRTQSTEGPITFAQARQLADAVVRPSWQRPGALHVSEDGYEDADGWLVVYGAREYLVDGDDDFVAMDAPAAVVDKHTGTVDLLPVSTHLGRLSRMTPVSVAVPRRLPDRRLVVPRRPQGSGAAGDDVEVLGPEHPAYPAWAAYIDRLEVVGPDDPAYDAWAAFVARLEADG